MLRSFDFLLNFSNCKQLSIFSGNHINEKCTSLIGDSDSPSKLQQIAQIFRRNFDIPPNGCIRMDYAHEVERMSQTNTTFALRARPWFYQTCSEFGWYQSTDSKDQPFGTKSPINYELRLCKDAFGDAFDNVSSEQNMHHTNVIYGDYNPAVTNVYFTQGSLDPWHPMGIWKDINDHSPGIMIEGLIFILFSIC